MAYVVFVDPAAPSGGQRNKMYPGIRTRGPSEACVEGQGTLGWSHGGTLIVPCILVSLCVSDPICFAFRTSVYNRQMYV